MFDPNIVARMKKLNSDTWVTLGINARNIWTLKTVAIKATQGQISFDSLATMFFSNDVIDLKGKPREIG